MDKKNKKVALLGSMMAMTALSSKPAQSKPDIIIIGDENDPEMQKNLEAIKKAYPGKIIGFSTEIPEDRNFDLGKAFADINEQNRRVEIVTKEPEPIVSKYREKLKRKYLAQEARKKK